MITGKTKTEATYRALVMDSSSSLKEFSLDRKKYHKRYVLSEKVDDSDNKATTMGRLVETLLMEPQEFDNRFYMSTCMSTPTGLMLDFVEALYKHTEAATDGMGSVTRTFEEISRDAYADSGFKIKYDAVINKFIGSDSEVYYNEIRIVRSNGLTVVGSNEVNNAQKIVDELRTNPITAEIVNMVNSARWTVHNQFQIEGFSVDSHLFKSMLDKMIIDHQEKVVWIYDLKCVWAVEGFYEDYYLYRRAYIQAYLYYHAVKSLTIDSQSELSGYEVMLPRFIVCDSANYYSPLVYTLSKMDILDAYEGFEHKGRKYPGVKQIIGDLKWAIENDVWNISKTNFINNGILNLKD
jgi:hypothetical protein